MDLPPIISLCTGDCIVRKVTRPGPCPGFQADRASLTSEANIVLLESEVICWISAYAQYPRATICLRLRVELPSDSREGTT